MKATKPLLAFFPALMLLSGCLSLDPFLFSGEKLDSYELEMYNGEAECKDAMNWLDPISSNRIREVSIASGNETIAAVIVGSKLTFSSTDTIILYLHGKAYHIDFYWPRTRLLEASGYPVMIIDYRGYGKSSGTPTEEGIYEDGFSALTYIRDSLGNPGVVIYAYSMGSLVGCELASKDTSGKILGLVLEAPIGSVETLVQDATYLDFPGAYVTTYKGNNAERIKSVKVPFLWLHGTADETLALKTNGEPIWNNYTGRAGFKVIVEGASHTNIPKKITYSHYVRGVTRFIKGNGADDPLLQSR